MRRVAAALGVVSLAAGCGGGGSRPEIAYLTAVGLDGHSISFTFRSEPREVGARYEPRAHLAECGSGRPVPVRGTAFLGVHFRPAATAEAAGDSLTFTYHGPKRLHAPGPLREAVKICDFEADVGWAIGLDRRLPFHVARDGATVTLRFG